MIEKNPVYQRPYGYSEVIVGNIQMSDITISYDILRDKYGIDFIIDEVTDVNFEQRSVHTAQGRKVIYDRLVVSPGIDFDYSRVPGMESLEAQAKILHGWDAGQQLLTLKQPNQVIGKDVPGMNVRSEIPMLEKVGFTHAAVFWPEEQREITIDNAHEVGRTLAITTCSKCHSLSETGMRPLRNYFGSNIDIARIQTYLHGALATGNTMYMPRIPLQEKELATLGRCHGQHCQNRRLGRHCFRRSAFVICTGYL